MATDGDEHVSFDVGTDAPARDYEEQRLDKRTLTTMNLNALEHAKEQTLFEFVLVDFWSNLTVVTFPACFTNTLWRGMNLNYIAVHDSPYGVIWDTTWKIATAVFVLCAVIDMLRQLFIANRTSRATGENASLGVIWEGYIANSGWRSSLNLGWKFFGGVVGWTAGYEIVAGTAQMLSSKDETNIIRHAIGAAIGTSIGLWLACESINYMDYFALKPGTQPNHRGAAGVAVKGFFEGFVWSIIADHNTYIALQNRGVPLSSANFLDSVAVGFGSSPFFTLMGIFTSIAGFYYLRSLPTVVEYEPITQPDKEMV